MKNINKILVLSFVFLTSCSLSSVSSNKNYINTIRLKRPNELDIIICSKNSTTSIIFDDALERCALKYEEMGYVRFENLTIKTIKKEEFDRSGYPKRSETYWDLDKDK